MAAQKRLEFARVLGKDDPAGLYAKNLDCKTVDKHVTALKGHYTNGRAASALQLHLISRPISALYEDIGKDSPKWIQLLQHKIQNLMSKVRRNQGQRDNWHIMVASKDEQRAWYKESLPSENRGQFLTMRWRIILKTYPNTDRDRREIAKKVKEEERLQMLTGMPASIQANPRQAIWTPKSLMKTETRTAQLSPAHGFGSVCFWATFPVGIKFLKFDFLNLILRLEDCLKHNWN